MLFLEHQMLDMKNVVACRADASADAINGELNRAKVQMDSSQMRRNGKAVLSINGGESWFLFPLADVPERIPQGWLYKERFHLENAVKTRHEGEYARLGESIDALCGYVGKRGLTTITGKYCALIREWSDGIDPQNVIIDIYVGVSNNDLL